MKKLILAACLCLTLLTGCATTGRHDMEPPAAVQSLTRDPSDRPTEHRQPIRNVARCAVDVVLAPVAYLALLVFGSPVKC